MKKMIVFNIQGASVPDIDSVRNRLVSFFDACTRLSPWIELNNEVKYSVAEEVLPLRDMMKELPE